MGLFEVLPSEFISDFSLGGTLSDSFLPDHGFSSSVDLGASLVVSDSSAVNPSVS